MTGSTSGETPLTPVRWYSRWVWWLVAGVAAALLAFAGLRVWLQANASPRYGIVVDSATPATNFTLDSTLGHPVALSDFRGKPVLLYFGYTSCPDICPTTLADLRMAMQSLGNDSSKVQVLFVSVDPERDTIERLGAFLPYFDPSFVGLSGALADIESIASRFGVFFQKDVKSSATDYLIDHTSAVLLLDSEGKLRLMFPYGTTGEQIASDTKLFMQ